MEKFYIITNDMKDANRKITVKIKKCIESYGKKCYLEEQPEEGNFSKIKIPKDIDCVLTVGGDGTFIQASRRLFGRELPMLGINMGTLGYLTEVEVQNVEEAVKRLNEVGFPSDLLFNKKLKGIGDLERLAGKKILAEVLKDVIIKPNGLPTLAPESDKRPALENALNDFDKL